MTRACPLYEELKEKAEYKKITPFPENCDPRTNTRPWIKLIKKIKKKQKKEMNEKKRVEWTHFLVKIATCKRLLEFVHCYSYDL
ncbi:MAG: hypothetical protein KAS07_02270 [Candidatus Pacebacteria bacterium]|nr:hypothetical protein [Candidatus Paceibacterota bacterium]